MANPTNMISSTEVLGGRLLKEIAKEEESLEDLLSSLRKSHPSYHQNSKTNIPPLDALIHARGSKTLAISGRPWPLIYALIISLLSPAPSSPGSTIALVDLTRRFSPSHLLPGLPLEELKHIHVFQPTRANFQATLDSVESYMLYGDHESKGREWKGFFVLGEQLSGIGTVPREAAEGERLVVTAGWGGWLRVERVEEHRVGFDTSVEEAWAERAAKGDVVEEVKWKAVCDQGEFTFK